MKRVFLIMLVGCFLVGCKNTGSNLAASDQQTIEYQIDNNQYAVVIVQTDGMSEDQAKKMAMQKAAEKTRNQNLRYFTIESEGEIQAIRSGSTAYDNPSPPTNMYYDLIQSGNFSRDRFDNQSNPQENTYQGYRVVFKCYAEKPNDKAVDACDILSCGK